MKKFSTWWQLVPQIFPCLLFIAVSTPKHPNKPHKKNEIVQNKSKEKKKKIFCKKSLWRRQIEVIFQDYVYCNCWIFMKKAQSNIGWKRNSKENFNKLFTWLFHSYLTWHSALSVFSHFCVIYYLLEFYHIYCCCWMLWRASYLL